MIILLSLPLSCLTTYEQQVHISEARVSTALDKLAYMEELVNDRLLQDRNTAELDTPSTSPGTSTQTLDSVNRRVPKKSLNVSGPVEPYHPRLKNFWYPVAFSSDLKDDIMVTLQITPPISFRVVVVLWGVPSY